GPGTSATPVPPSRPDSARTPADTGRRVQPPTPSPRPETPVSLTFLGPLYQEEKPLALGHAYQRATGFHLRRPPGLSGWSRVPKADSGTTPNTGFATSSNEDAN